MQKQKGFATVLVMIALLIIGGLIILVPIPSLVTEGVHCKPCVYEDPSLCPKCPQKGDIIWNPPLINSIFSSTSQESENVRSCGGLAGEIGKAKCPEGYRCEYPKPMYSDASGKCIKE